MSSKPKQSAKLETLATPQVWAGVNLLSNLRADIVSNKFEPKAKLKFAELTKRYDVGIGTLREALSHLVSEGFVALDAGRGYRVADVSINDLNEIIEHYVEFETKALADSIEHGDDDWEAEIVSSFHRLSIIQELPWEERMNRHDEWVVRHADFHSALISACQAHWLHRLRTLMFNQAERYRFLSKMTKKGDPKKSHEHKKIMAASLARDKDLACKLMDEHIRGTAENVFQHLSSVS